MNQEYMAFKINQLKEWAACAIHIFCMLKPTCTPETVPAPHEASSYAQSESTFLRKEQAKRHKAPPWEFVKTFQQSQSGQRIGNPQSGLLLSLSFSPFCAVLLLWHIVFRHCTTSIDCLVVEHGRERNLRSPLQSVKTKKLRCPADRLTMKLLFVLLVSCAWTLIGAQNYYQALMDYLENRLLAIEVRNKPPF